MAEWLVVLTNGDTIKGQAVEIKEKASLQHFDNACLKHMLHDKKGPSTVYWEWLGSTVCVPTTSIMYMVPYTGEDK